MKTTAAIPTTKYFCGWSHNMPNKSKMADGQHFEKMINFYISAIVWTILMKCCIVLHIGPPYLNGCSKIQISNNTWWRMAAILKNVKCCISTTVFHEIWYSDAYCTSQPNWLLKICNFKNTRWPMAAILKIEKLWYSKTIWPVLTKFCIVVHIGPLGLNGCSKIRILKIKDGRRPSFWKTLNAVPPQPFQWFWWILVWCAY